MCFSYNFCFFKVREDLWFKFISRGALIYSHGNAADCGSMLPRCALLAEKLNVDVYLYDYEGYGYSTGVHCDETIRADIEQVFELVLKSFNSNRIFLYGESSKSFLFYCDV